LQVQQEVAWYREYYAATGAPWLSLINRPKPTLNMWPAEGLGQTHTVRIEARRGGGKKAAPAWANGLPSEASHCLPLLFVCGLRLPDRR
jgi:hypothetical protein